jgi:PleD family two-component response regulator
VPIRIITTTIHAVIIIKLFLVDEDDIDRERIKRTLSNNKPSDQANTTSNKYHITCASYYQQALDLLEKNHFDICLFDYYLNDHSGLELLKKAQEINPSTSIIVLTGLVYDAIDDELLLAGTADFLHKDDITNTVLNRAILYIDIDYFKTINDEYGHFVGDMQLKKFANRLIEK